MNLLERPSNFTSNELNVTSKPGGRADFIEDPEVEGYKSMIANGEIPIGHIASHEIIRVTPLQRLMLEVIHNDTKTASNTIYPEELTIILQSPDPIVNTDISLAQGSLTQEVTLQSGVPISPESCKITKVELRSQRKLEKKAHKAKKTKERENREAELSWAQRKAKWAEENRRLNTKYSDGRPKMVAAPIRLRH